MTIEVYPVKIEAIQSEDARVIFTMTTFDEYCAEFKFEGLLTNGNIEDVIAAIRKAFALLELK